MCVYVGGGGGGGGGEGREACDFLLLGEPQNGAVLESCWPHPIP